MPKRLLAASILTLAMAGALPVQAAAPAAVPPRPAANVLTETYAAYRREQVGDTRYDLALHLRPDSETYTGEVGLRFDYTVGSGDVTIDYAGKRVLGVAVNGRSVPVVYNQAFITLPSHYLQPQNEVRIRFESTYDTTGIGFMRFVDPVDGYVYLYTDFEPYAAHHLFPCFDQPDLKARLSLTVTAPADWTVIANMPETGRQTRDGERVTTFAPTPPISPYLFAVHAGRYVGWHAKAGNVPLALYARASLARHVDAEDLFDVTRRGLAFFNAYFGYPYPFAKYDQVFVPELASSAMENVGAVTLNEDMIFRHQVTDRERFDRDATVLHEMAHMWFGNLVTMTWWNGLWLNESFATYMEGLSKAAIPRYGDSWIAFHGLKEWAYATDQRITTHPIEADVPDTDAAFANFDGITYGKGAAAIKQLAYYIGPTAFREGMRDYFQSHAWGNTTLADFLGALQRRTDQDLTAWSRSWLQTAGLNTLTPSWQVQDGRISRFELRQGVASGQQTLRPHRTEIGLFSLVNGRLQLTERLPAAYTGAITPVPAAVGKAAPAFVYANVGDQDYVKTVLDPVSLATAKAHLSRIEDPFVRRQVWGSLWEMVEDRRLDVPAYLELVRRHLPGETDTATIESQLQRLQRTYLSYLAPEERRHLADEIEGFAWSQLQSAEAGSDIQLMWARRFVSLARSPKGQSRLHGLLTGQDRVSGLDLNQELRWAIVENLVAGGWPDAEALLAAERARDGSADGLKAAAAIQAARPQAKAKAEAWQTILTDESTSMGLLSGMMGGFHGFDQDELLRPYAKAYFAALPDLVAKRGAVFATTFAERLFPRVYEEATLQEAERLLARPDLPGSIRRPLMEGHEAMKRVLAIRQLARTALQKALATSDGR